MPGDNVECDAPGLDTLTLFSALNSESRQRILRLVAANGEVCVCEVVDALGISQPSVSKAFSSLRSAGLVEARRDANWTYYRLATNLDAWAGQVLSATISRLEQDEQCRQDQARFNSLASERPRELACP